MKKIGILVFLLIAMLSCVQEEFEKEITFLVDTYGIENVKSIGIRGDFLPKRWNESVSLSDDNNDGVYELTLTERTAVYGIEFKFVKNGLNYELKEQENREIIFRYQPEKIIYKTTFNNTNVELIKE